MKDKNTTIPLILITLIIYFIPSCIFFSYVTHNILKGVSISIGMYLVTLFIVTTKGREL